MESLNLFDEIIYQSVSQMVGSGIISSRVDQSAVRNETNLAFEDSDDGSQVSDDEHGAMVHYDSEGEVYLRLDLDLNERSNDQNRDDHASAAAREEAPASAAQDEGIDVIDDPLLEWNFVDYQELLEDVHEYDHHILDEVERTNLLLNHGIIKRPSGTILHPNHEEYKLESKRLDSFKLWPGGTSL